MIHKFHKEIPVVKEVQVAWYTWNRRETNTLDKLQVILEQMEGTKYISDFTIYSVDEDHVGLWLIHN